MAGYRHKKKRIDIAFEEGHEFHGLEVSLRGMSLGGFLEIQGIGAVDKSTLADQLQRFAESLIEWNLEDEETGEPVPATPEAVYAQDQELMLMLATHWINALKGGLSAPLERPSPDGEPSLEASIPMETVSSPLAS
jgi:hypothetical protein